MFRLIILFALFIKLGLLFSCEENKNIEDSLRKQSSDFFQKKNINQNDFKTEYYIVSNPKIGYTHYVLKCFQVIDNDSVIIYFSRDDTADYWIESNESFHELYK